ncbi:hypothetical protein MAR_000585 [Mya arenaria]|uniref:Uncharacterized protein n=1 Tax=Mya arenaria TaxID=6604 RepID=A0ABY7FCJ5_MYAAR|nr:hypothetical protein MAR_000585 [Mya arenaria]
MKGVVSLDVLFLITQLRSLFKIIPTLWITVAILHRTRDKAGYKKHDSCAEFCFLFDTESRR